MGLSRKRKRELKKLQELSAKLVSEQREVLDKATSVLSEAGLQVRHLSNEHFAPRARSIFNRVSPKVRQAYDYVRPGINNGVDYARDIADKVATAGRPVAERAFESTVSALQANNQKDLAKRLQKFGASKGIVKKKRGGFLTTLGIIFGVVAVGAAGYAFWQATRVDDDVWIAAEQDGE